MAPHSPSGTHNHIMFTLQSFLVKARVELGAAYFAFRDTSSFIPAIPLDCAVQGWMKMFVSSAFLLRFTSSSCSFVFSGDALGNANHDARIQFSRTTFGLFAELAEVENPLKIVLKTARKHHCETP